jgi:hypothetical protein
LARRRAVTYPKKTGKLIMVKTLHKFPRLVPALAVDLSQGMVTLDRALEFVHGEPETNIVPSEACLVWNPELMDAVNNMLGVSETRYESAMALLEVEAVTETFEVEGPEIPIRHH